MEKNRQMISPLPVLNQKTPKFTKAKNYNQHHRNKKLSLSSLNLDVNTSNEFSNEESKNLNQFTDRFSFSDLNFSNKSLNLPKFYLDERNNGANCKTDIHKSIIEIGEQLHISVIKELERGYEKRLRQKEFELREIFRREKEMQVEKERIKFSAKLDTIKSQLKNDYERLLRDKAVEIEIYTQNISKEQIELNKIEAKKHLEETVENLNEKFQIEKAKAVETAIKQQKSLAETKLDEQKSVYEKKLNELNEAWMSKLSTSLEELRAKMNKSMEKAVSWSKEEAKAEKELEVEKTRDEYERRIDRERVEYQAKIDDLTKLHGTIEDLKVENQQLKSFINELKQEFQNSIQRFSHMKNKECDFLFNSIGECLNLKN